MLQLKVYKPLSQMPGFKFQLHLLAVWSLGAYLSSVPQFLFTTLCKQVVVKKLTGQYM